MVTAIVIPIICFYFFWLTKKEMKENDVKWMALADVRQEAVLTGEIKSIHEEKQRFYYHRYIYVQELQLQTGTKLVKAIKTTPFTKTAKIESFNKGDIIKAYGSWKNNHFYFSQFEYFN